MTRSLLSFVLACVVSWGAGEAADCAQEKLARPQPIEQKSAELFQLLKDENLKQH